MKLFTFITIIFLSTISTCLAEEYIDVINLKNGTVIEGYIIEQVSNKSLTIKKLDGELIKLNFDQVEKITKKDKAKVSYYDRNYWEAGINIGMPAVLNLLVGRWFSPVGIKVSGLTLGEIYGIQGNLMYKLADSEKTCHSLGLIGGYSHLVLEKSNGWEVVKEIKEWQYYGAAYNLNWGGFWLELGLTAGSGDFKSPQFCFQIGYAHRFIE